MRDSVCAVGEAERAVAPISDKYELAGKLGLEIKLTPDAAAAVGELLVRLARYIDLQEAIAERDKHLNRLIVGLIAASLLLVVMARAA